MKMAKDADFTDNSTVYGSAEMFNYLLQFDSKFLSIIESCQYDCRLFLELKISQEKVQLLYLYTI